MITAEDRHRRELFARTLREHMEDGGWSAAALAAACTDLGAPISVPALRAWAQGTSAPIRTSSREVVAAAETAMGLPAGTLLPLLGPQPTGAGIRSDPRGRILRLAFEEIAEQWGLQGARSLDRQAVCARLSLDGSDRGRVEHTVVLGREDERTGESGAAVILLDGSVAHNPVREVADPPADALRDPHRGVRAHPAVRRVAPLPFATLAVELVPERPPDPGQSAVIELECTLPVPSARRGTFNAFALDAADLLTAQVDLSAAMRVLPLFWARWTRRNDGGAMHHAESLGGAGRRTAPSIIVDAVECGAFVDWEWPKS